MRSDTVWSLIRTIKGARIYKMNDRYVVTRSSYNKSYGYTYSQETYNTYEDAVAAL